MRLIDLDQTIFVPIVDESHGGVTYEMQMTIAEFFDKFLDGFKPEVVDAAPVIQRWISVKDRLPEAAGWYLVFYNGSQMQVAFFKGKKWPFDNHYHKVTHWMPLPKPPKEGT